MNAQIRLETLSDIHDFVRACSNVEKPVHVTDKAGHCVSAKSILGMLYSMEWDSTWCECEDDIYSVIGQYVVD